MFPDHLGLALFMLLLLIAPQLPVEIPGGITGGNISLGVAGLVIWILFRCRRKLPPVPFSTYNHLVRHPLFWLNVFALYAFLMSLISASTMSIAYGIQFLFYSFVLGFLMMPYHRKFPVLYSTVAGKIVLSVGIIFSIAIIVSTFTGPLYPHQARWTQRTWGGAMIQQGVGFSESQNLAGPVVVFFLAFCAFMYRGEPWKKWCLLVLMLYALMATFSRAVIASFVLAQILLFGMDLVKCLLRKMKSRQLLKQLSFGLSGMLVSLAVFILVNSFVYKSFFLALETGVGIEKRTSYHSQRIAVRDLSRRLDRWKHGIDYWQAQSLTGKIFGRGFRASMEISSDRESWYCAHNLYITILGDFGLIGLAVFLIMILKAFRDFVCLSLAPGSEHIGKFGLLVLIALSIDNLTGPYFYSPVCLSLLIISLSMVCFRIDS